MVVKCFSKNVLFRLHLNFRDNLESELKACKVEKQSVELKLASFEILGKEFEALAEEYCRLRQELEMKHWALKEFTQYNDKWRSYLLLGKKPSIPPILPCVLTHTHTLAFGRLTQRPCGLFAYSNCVACTGVNALTESSSLKTVVKFASINYMLHSAQTLVHCNLSFLHQLIMRITPFILTARQRTQYLLCL